MRWNFVPNSNTRVLALKSGEAQIADGIPFSQVSSLQGESSLEVQQVELPQEVLLVTNTKAVPALADPHVRRALSLAINRQQLNETVFRGTGTIPNSVIQNFELDASDQEVPPFEFNLAKAKEENGGVEIRQGVLGQPAVPGGLRLLQADGSPDRTGAGRDRRQHQAGRTGIVGSLGKVVRRRIPV